MCVSNRAVRYSLRPCLRRCASSSLSGCVRSSYVCRNLIPDCSDRLATTAGSLGTLQRTHQRNFTAVEPLLEPQSLHLTTVVRTSTFKLNEHYAVAAKNPYKQTVWLLNIWLYFVISLVSAMFSMNFLFTLLLRADKHSMCSDTL